MKPVLTILVVLAIAIAVYERLKDAGPKGGSTHGRSWRSRPMFTTVEARAYKMLVYGIGQRYIVLSKVRLSDVVEPTGPKDKDWWSQRQRQRDMMKDEVLGKAGVRVLRVSNEDIVRERPIPVYETLLEIENPQGKGQLPSVAVEAPDEVDDRV